MRLIDADRLFEVIDGNVPAPYEDSREAKEECLREIDEALTIDAVPVIRCKDCKHHDEGENFIYCWALQTKCPDDPEFFCKYGKRKEIEY